MLAVFILLYVAVTLALGLLASRLVKTNQDFVLAGHRLPLWMATFTVFATWFGSETVLGASERFAEKGWLGVMEDPFGAALCLILVGLFFARRLYRLNLLTFGDFYRIRFGKRAELIASLCLILSYFGWIAAQLVALGIVFSLVLGIDRGLAIAGSSIIVIAYTFTGGMWAVSITDTLQSVMIIVGLAIVVAVMLPLAGGLQHVLESMPAEHSRILPEPSFAHVMEYIAAWITLGLGSIPQQDVYQRVMSSKNEKVAVASSLLGGILYLTVGMIPLVLGVIAAKLPGSQQHSGQMMVPGLVMNYGSVGVQVLFFGALISAIMSTASGAILAPASILSENILRHRLQAAHREGMMLRITRISVLATGLVSLFMALLRQDVYELVSEASAISLVSLFIPLVMGLFFHSRKHLSAIASMVAGLAGWALFHYLIETEVPAIFWGLLFSAAGWILGSGYARLSLR